MPSNEELEPWHGCAWLNNTKVLRREYNMYCHWCDATAVVTSMDAKQEAEDQLVKQCPVPPGDRERLCPPVRWSHKKMTAVRRRTK